VNDQNADQSDTMPFITIIAYVLSTIVFIRSIFSFVYSLFIFITIYRACAFKYISVPEQKNLIIDTCLLIKRHGATPSEVR